MAEATHTGGASLASASWSDASGFSATTPQLAITSGSQLIENDLDYSGITGVEYFDVREGARVTIEGAGGTPMIFDADKTAESAVTHVSRVRLHGSEGRIRYSSAGGSGVCHFLECGNNQEVILQGGTVKNLVVDGNARFTMTAAAAFAASSTAVFTGGGAYLAGHASDLFDDIIIEGGNHKIKRGATATTGTLTVNGGVVEIDCDTANIPIIKVAGTGYLIVTSFTPDSGTRIYGTGGTIDFRPMKKGITGTGWRFGPKCLVYDKPSLLTRASWEPYGTGGKFVA